MADEDDTGDTDPEGIWCRHLIVCRTLWFEPSRSDDAFSLGKLVVQLRPPDGDTLPIHVDRLFTFVQLTGTPGPYTLRALLVRIERVGYDGEDEVPVLRHGRPTQSGPWDIELFGQEFFEGFAFSMANLRFDEPGVYEFQLHADGYDDPLARERLYVHE